MRGEGGRLWRLGIGGSGAPGSQSPATADAGSERQSPSERWELEDRALASTPMGGDGCLLFLLSGPIHRC